MSLSIIDRGGVLTAELHELVERRLRFALARFDSRIQRVSVMITDEKGPRGVESNCQITIKLIRGNDVVVGSQDLDPAECIARSADRAGRAVARAMERELRINRSNAVGLRENPGRF